MFRSTRTLPAAAVISAAAILSAGMIGLAQEQSADPSMAASQPAVEDSHPINIHEGTCDALGDKLFPLGQISRDLMVHSEEADTEPVGGVDSQNVALNLTLVDASIEDLTGSHHALSIGESEDNMEMRVACGDIAGRVVGDGVLVIRLDEHDDSGFLGVALFEAADDGNTKVYSFLTGTESKVDSPELPELLPSIAPLESMDADAEDLADVDDDPAEESPSA